MNKLLEMPCCVLAAIALASCGGGGSRPIATPVPPPAPPPAPPPPVYASFAAPAGDQQVPLTGVQVTNTVSYGVGILATVPETTAVGYSSGRLSISYNGAAGSYTVRDNARSSEFRPSDINPTDNTHGGAFVNYRHNRTPDAEDRLALYRPTGGGGEVALTYTTLALWTRATVDLSGNVERVHHNAVWGVGGFETVAGDMPRTGNATYIGPLRGFDVTDAARAVTGQSRLTADFAALTVQAELSIIRGGFPTLLLNGAGQINSSRFSGALNGGGYSGSYEGAFFGPRAAEMGLSFLVRDAAGRPIAGVGAGRQ